MKNSKQKRLEAAGWKVGSTADFLNLSNEESAFVEMKLALAHSLKKKRTAKKLTQADVAELIGSSQSRIAKMEAADAEVSMDLLIKALLALGVTRKGLATIIAQPRSRFAA